MEKKISALITITVQEPQINTTGQQYVTYLIKGSDKNGDFSIRRRYNQFYALRQQLVDRWLGLYIPPIASKKATENKKEKFVEQRKRFFHYFCIKISERPFLFYSQEFQLFLRSTTDLQKAFKELPPINFKEKLQIYSTYFQQSHQRLNEAQTLIMNETDYDYLKRAQKKYDSLRQQFKAVAQTKRLYANQFVHIYLNILPQYEEKFLLHHVGKDRQKLIVNKDSVKVNLKQYQSLANHNPLQDYVQMISYELRESRAFIQAIQSRKKAQDIRQKLEKKRIDNKQELDKLQSGKSTFKSFFSSGNKEQQIQRLEKQTALLDIDIQSLNKLIPLMNAACHQEIKRYKTKRGKQYVNILKQVATKQIKELASYGNILKVPLAQYNN